MQVVDDSSASGNEDDAFSSENNWHRNEMSEGSEVQIRNIFLEVHTLEQCEKFTEKNPNYFNKR